MEEKFLNINFQEINKCNEDILSRDNFVNNICLLLNDKLLENKERKTITIGINGRWGIGKTSIKNMIFEKLNNNNFLKIEVNPNNCYNLNNFYDYFYTTLNDFLYKDYKNNKKNYSNKKDIEDFLFFNKITEIYNSCLSITKKPLLIIIPFLLAIILLIILQKFEIKNHINIVFSIITTIISGIFLIYKNYINILNKKEFLEKVIKTNKKSIIIFLDDLDRKEENEIYEICNIIKNNSYSLNVCFILFYDKNILINKIQNKYLNNNYCYFEKFINYNLDLPLIASNQIIKNVVKKYFSKYNIDFKEIDWDSYKKFITNIRDFNLFFAMFEFDYNLIKDFEFEIKDFIKIEIIKIFENKIYDYIKDNIGYFLKLNYHKKNITKSDIINDLKLISSNRIEFKNIKNLLENIFLSFGNEDEEDYSSSNKDFSINSKNWRIYFLNTYNSINKEQK